MATFRAKRRFALEPGGPERLEVSWVQGLESVRVAFDGEVVARFPDEKSFRKGARVMLASGGTLEVRWVRGVYAMHDGKRVAEGIKFYESRVHNAWLWLLANGVVCAGLAPLYWYAAFDVVHSLALGAVAAVLLASAAFVREGARKPILVGIALSVLDAYFFLDETHAGRALMMLVGKGIWIGIMMQAYRAGGVVETQRRRVATERGLSVESSTAMGPPRSSG